MPRRRRTFQQHLSHTFKKIKSYLIRAETETVKEGEQRRTRRLLPSSRGRWLLITPFLLWVLVLFAVYIASQQLLVALTHVLEELNDVNILKAMVERVAFFAHVRRAKCFSCVHSYPFGFQTPAQRGGYSCKPSVGLATFCSTRRPFAARLKVAPNLKAASVVPLLTAAAAATAFAAPQEMCLAASNVQKDVWRGKLRDEMASLKVQYNHLLYASNNPGGSTVMAGTADAELFFPSDATRRCFRQEVVRGLLLRRKYLGSALPPHARRCDWPNVHLVPAAP